MTVYKKKYNWDFLFDLMFHALSERFLLHHVSTAASRNRLQILAFTSSLAVQLRIFKRVESSTQKYDAA